MFKFSKRIVLATVAIASMFVSCVDADSMFGNSFVPPEQELSTFIDSGLTVRTTMIMPDSIPTQRTGAIFIGSYTSEIFGNTTASGFSTYFPIGFESDTLFGVEPTVDSMLVSLYFNGCVGDTSYKMQISVHQVIDTVLQTDNNYFSNFNAEPYYDKTPIFEFILSGEDSTVKTMMPKSFYEKFLLNDYNGGDNPYSNDSLFIDKFKGFYFKMNNLPEAGVQGALRQISLTSSYMKMYYHNKQNGKVEPDTTTHEYYFFNNQVRGGNNFSLLSHDYSMTDVANGGVNESLIGSDIEIDRCMIQGMGGVGTKLVIDTMHIEKIKADAKALGYRHIGIQKASVKWGLESRTLGTSISYEAIQRAATTLPLYYDFGALDFLKDYQPIQDTTSLTQDQTAVSSIGGTLNRSTLCYNQNISSAMQALFNKPEGEYYKDNTDYKYIMELLPAWNEMLFYNETVVGGSASLENKPKIVLVYTLVK